MSSNPSLRILLTTDPGIEVSVERELIEKSSERGFPTPEVITCPTGHAGTVEARFPEDGEKLREFLFELRSIHHILRELDLFKLPAPGDEQLMAIRKRVDQLEVPEFREGGDGSFRVSCDRLGAHSFSSMDVLREAGASVQAKYELPVDLEEFTHHFRVDIYENACRIGLQWSSTPLSKRGRPFLPRIALKGNVAFSLLQSLGAGSHEKGPLLDPFCGSGTILLEAASIFPSMLLYGNDNFSRNIPGADRNLRAFGLRDRVDLREHDARDLSELHPPESIRYIATNPPYGLRMGSRLNFFKLYTKFLDQAARILVKKGRMAILVMKKGLFLEVLEKDGRFHTLEERELVLGKIHIWLYLLEKE